MYSVNVLLTYLHATVDVNFSHTDQIARRSFIANIEIASSVRCIPYV